MSKRGVGNVDNHANVGNQTIINIQNMTGNIGTPDKKSESVNTVALGAFDQQVNDLDGIMKGIVDTLGKDATRQASKDEWQEFYLALQDTVATIDSYLYSFEDGSKIVGILQSFIQKSNK